MNNYCVSLPTGNIGEKVVELHRQLKQDWPQLSRMAIALYDRETDWLKTFVRSDEVAEPLQHYSAKLDAVPSLRELAYSGKARLLQDLEVLAGSTSQHSRWLLRSGFRSSYTVPLYNREHLLGFLFFDAEQSHYFSGLMLKVLGIYAELIGVVLSSELASSKTLHGAINTVKRLTHHRDEETAAHIRRVSQYSHLIAQHVAAQHGLSDAFVEFILQYSPLHDIGKIAIPDHILLKPGRLDARELAVVQRHVEKGVEILDSIIEEFGFANMDHLVILRNIIATHHERFDGSGYPQGLRGEAIPLEGRITAVADVLDALTTTRPYKSGWAFADAVEFIRQKSGRHFDPDCVQVLLEHTAEFEAIYRQFRNHRD